MPQLRMLVVGLAVLGASCNGHGPASITVAGAYTLTSENGQPLPSDPGAPNGCCLTLSGSVSFTGSTYALQTSHRNKNHGINFDNSEHGVFSQQGRTLTFSREGGGGLNVPYLLGQGTVSADNSTVTLLYGDEGPGSNQISATFQR